MSKLYLVIIRPIAWNMYFNDLVAKTTGVSIQALTRGTKLNRLLVRLAAMFK
jgi:hypothetical protein